MKLLVRLLILFLVIGLMAFYYAGLNRSTPVKPIIEEKRPNLAAIFSNRNYSQYIDQFGTVARTAFDASGKRVGTQVGTYCPGARNGMVVEMTYLEPDAEHPLGQAFDGAGNPKPLTTGPRVNHT
jgi:hypothetical protein